MMENQELIDKCDKCIGELVYPKVEIQKAYNYYNGIRDADLFRYLEEVYGIDTPTTLHFTPLVRKHIDALIGEYLSTPVIPKISCKDEETISNIDREKQLKVAQELQNYLKSHLKSAILNIMNGKDTNDSFIEQQIKAIQEDLNTNFVSSYEIAAQDVLEYIMQSRDTDIETVRRDLFFDLLISGYAFYKVEPTINNTGIKITVCDPRNTFIDRNPESPYVKNSYRAVVRHWLSKNEILNKYGKKLKKDDKDYIEEKWSTMYDDNIFYIQARDGENIPTTDGLLAGIEVTPGYPNNEKQAYRELLPVYEAEWLEPDEDFVMQRYCVTRIGEDIYILDGKDENVIRSILNPTCCGLSVNGIYFLNRGYKPYSLMLACAHLQDQYDLLAFYRDNLIASSGTVGDWIDLALIPEKLGVKMSERILKWKQLKKQGLATFDSSQEGAATEGRGSYNQWFNGYDDTVKEGAIQAIQLAMDSIEQTVSSITGVFRERLNMIEQRDAVTNIKQGVANSFIITKQWYHQMDLVMTEILIDCMNLAKRVWKKGLTGTLILGDKYQRVFTALPEHFTVTDHDIRILTSSEINRDLEQIKAIIPEFVKSGGLPPDIIMEVMTSKSIPDMKQKVKKALLIQKQENDLMQKMQQQIEQLQQQLKDTTSQLEKSNKELDKVNESKMQLEQQEQKMKYQLEWYKAKTEREYRESTSEERKRRTDIEEAQLYDGNPYNNIVRKTGSEAL